MTRTGLRFKRMFHERMRAARVAIQLDEAAIAQKLCLPTDVYVKFESISLPPHHLIPELCEILHITVNDLFGVREGNEASVAG
jgi:hypothetical protein